MARNRLRQLAAERLRDEREGPIVPTDFISGPPTWECRCGYTNGIGVPVCGHCLGLRPGARPQVKGYHDYYFGRHGIDKCRKCMRDTREVRR